MNWNCRTHFIEIQARVTVELDRSDLPWSVLSTNDRSKQENNQEQNQFHLRFYLFLGSGISMDTSRWYWRYESP